MNHSTIDEQEVLKFRQHAQSWWDPQGPLKTLHDINPVRLQFIQSLQGLAGKKVLDVGCGGGILTEAMAEHAAHCIGIDAEEQSIAVAQAHANERGLTIDYRALPLEALDEEGFDRVVCMEMLEHVRHPEQVILHCMRVLKPGGYLFLSTINRTMKAYLGAIVCAEYLLNLLPRQTHDYDKFIKPDELAQMIRKAGLELKELTGMSYNPFLRSAALTTDLSINYLVACRRPDNA